MAKFVPDREVAMPRPSIAAAAALLLCLACDHGNPVQPLPPPPPPSPPPVPPPPHTNHRPVAHITGPASGREGAWLHFSSTGSTDPDGDSLSVTWLAGDGRRFTSATLDSMGYQGYPLREWLWSYADNGTYVVSVIVADDSGAADTASLAVTIQNAPPVLESFWVPAQQAAGIPASVRVFYGDSGSADPRTITVDWGDGTSRSITTTDTTFVYPGRGWHADTLFHVYVAPGSYWPSVTVQDDDGGVSNSLRATAPVSVFSASERRTVAGYEVFDLGTLGGNSARPADFNDRGQVVGISSIATGAERAFLWDESGMHDLGTLGHESSGAARITAAGVIAGTVWTQFYDNGTVDYPRIFLRRTIAAIWQNGSGILLDSTQTRGGLGPHGTVEAMNGSGDVVWVEHNISSERYAWLWRNGSWDPLIPSAWGGAAESYPAAMNDRGEVVGRFRSHAFLWADGSMRDLGVLAPLSCDTPAHDCSAAAAMDINERGQVVGVSTDGARNDHFVLWENGTIRDLGSAPPSPWPEAGQHAVINERGQIAGSTEGKAYFWSDGNKVPLPSLGGAMEVVGLSENGEVAGTVQMGTGVQHVFVWSQQRGMVDLGTGPHGFSAAWVVDINARGDILGYTTPCIPDYYMNRCYDHGGPGDFATQVRAILWRNTQAAASR